MTPDASGQVLAEMIIFNESRLGGSRVLATYSKPRTCSTHLSLRYQVILRGGLMLSAQGYALSCNTQAAKQLVSK